MARVIPSAASSADAAIRTLAGFTSRLGKRCSISLAMCSMARPLVVWCSVRVLRVDPFGHVGNQRRVDVAALLVLRNPRLAFDRAAEVAARGLPLEFPLLVAVTDGFHASPVGVHPLSSFCARHAHPRPPP